MEMLALQKKVLQNLDFDRVLFKKELRKSLTWLDEEEIEELVEWLKSNYWNAYKKEIVAVFKHNRVKNVDVFHY